MYKDEALLLLKGGKDGILEWNRMVAAGKAHLRFSGVQLPGAKLIEAPPSISGPAGRLASGQGFLLTAAEGYR
jgi:hypothetical protein